MKKVSKFSKGWKIGTAIFSTCLVAGAGVGIYFGVVAPRTDSTDPGKDDPIVDPVDPIDPDDPTEKYSAEQKSALISAFEKAVGVDGEEPERGTGDYADYSLLKKLAQSIPDIFVKCNITPEQLNSVVDYLEEGDRIFASYDILGFLSVESYEKKITTYYDTEDLEYKDKTIVDLNLRVNFFDFVTETMSMLNDLISASEQVSIGIDTETMVSIYTSLIGQVLEYRVDLSDLYKRGNSSDLITATDDLTNIEEKLAEKYGANGTAYANMYTEFAKVYIKHAIADKVEAATSVSTAINDQEGKNFAVRMQNYIKGLNANNVNSEEYKLAEKKSSVQDLQEYVERLVKYIVKKNPASEKRISLGTDFDSLVNDCVNIYKKNIAKAKDFKSETFDSWVQSDDLIGYYYNGEETKLSPELFARINRWFDITRSNEAKGLGQNFNSEGKSKLKENFKSIFGVSSEDDYEEELIAVFDEFLMNLAGDMNQYFTEANDLFLGTLSIFENSLMSFLSNNFSKFEGAISNVLTMMLDAENASFSIAKALNTEDFMQSIQDVLDEKITEKDLAVKISEKLQAKVEKMKGNLKERADKSKALIVKTQDEFEEDVDDLLYGFRGTFGLAYGFGLTDIEDKFYDLIKTIENSPKYIMQYIDVINSIYDGAIATMEYIAAYSDSEDAYNISDYLAEFYIAFLKDAQEEKLALADKTKSEAASLIAEGSFGSRTKALVADGRLPLLVLKTVVAFLEGTGVYKPEITSGMTIDEFLSDNKTFFNAYGFIKNVLGKSDKLDYLAHITDEQIANSLVKEIPAGTTVSYEYDEEKKTYTITYSPEGQEKFTLTGITEDYLNTTTKNTTAKTIKTKKAIARLEDNDVNTIISIVMKTTILLDDIYEMSFINEETGDFYTLLELIRHFIPENPLKSEIVKNLLSSISGMNIDETIGSLSSELFTKLAFTLPADTPVSYIYDEEKETYTVSATLGDVTVKFNNVTVDYLKDIDTEVGKAKLAKELKDENRIKWMNGEDIVICRYSVVTDDDHEPLIIYIWAEDYATYDAAKTAGKYNNKITLGSLSTIPAGTSVITKRDPFGKYEVTGKTALGMDVEIKGVSESQLENQYAITLVNLGEVFTAGVQVKYQYNSGYEYTIFTMDGLYQTTANASALEFHATTKEDIEDPNGVGYIFTQINETIEGIVETVEFVTAIPVNYIFSTLLPYVFVDYIIPMPEVVAYGTDFYDLAKIFAYDLIVDGLNGENVGEKLRNVICMYILYGIGDPEGSIAGLPEVPTI